MAGAGRGRLEGAGGDRKDPQPLGLGAVCMEPAMQVEDKMQAFCASEPGLLAPDHTDHDGVDAILDSDHV